MLVVSLAPFITTMKSMSFSTVASTKAQSLDSNLLAVLLEISLETLVFQSLFPTVRIMEQSLERIIAPVDVLVV